MELYQVRAFVTVARVGNVTRAADALCVTQPAVTAQIKGLENSLGVALFDRGGRRISLARAGEINGRTPPDAGYLRRPVIGLA